MDLSSAAKNVGICETQPITAEGLRSVLELTEDMRVIWQVDSLMGAIDLVKSQPPALLLADKSFGSQSLLQF